MDNAKNERNIYLKAVNTISFKFNLVNEDDIKKIFNNIQAKNSTGLDELSTKLLKLIQVPLIPALCIVINQSLFNGIFPCKLKLAKVKPLFKKNDQPIFTNYRPISLLPSLSKVFERIVHTQVYNYFNSNN